MNYVISICDPRALEVLTQICAELAIPMNVVLHAHGTAVRSMLDISQLQKEGGSGAAEVNIVDSI